MNTMKLETYTLGGECKVVEAPIVGYDPKFNLPILDIPMMSDERWNELCIKQTLHNYRTYSGFGEAPDYETAKKWEREYFGLDDLDKVEKKETPRYTVNEKCPL